MTQQSLSLIIASPLAASSFAAGISSVQVRSRLSELDEVVAVASVQYTFGDQYANLRTKLLIETTGMEATLHFIEHTEGLLTEWLEAAGLTVSSVTLSLPEA